MVEVLSTPLDVVKKKIRVRMNDLADTVSTGGCRDFAEYRFLCGTIQGLALVERDIIDLEEAVKKAEEKDE